MHLCFVVPEYASRPPLGGIATYTRDTARWLVQHGHSVHVVCVTRTSPPGRENDDGVQVHFVRPTRIRPRSLLRLAGRVPGLGFLSEAYAGWDLLENSLGAWRAVWRLDHQIPFDVIVCADFGGLAFWGLLSGKRSRVVVRGHGYLNTTLPHVDWPGQHFHHAMERYCVRRTGLIQANSAYLADAYCNQFGVDRQRIEVSPNGFVLPTLSPPESKSLRSDHLWATNPIVLYVGRLEEQKGSDLLFNALESARSDCPELRLVMLGTVSERFIQTYERFMKKNQEWVWHPGPVSPQEVAEIMQQADILVLPSRTETFGRVLVEAQLCGCAVIGARLGGIPEIIEHELTGLLTEPDDQDSLAKAILRLCQSSELRQSLAVNGRARAEQQFGIDAAMARHVTLYRRFLGQTLDEKLGLSSSTR